MSVLGIRAIIFGALSIGVVVSGIVLSSLGRPLNMALSTVHKLIAVASVVLAVLTVLAMQKGGGVGPLDLALVLVAAAGLLSLFATGAFLMNERPVNAALLAIHRAAPLLTAVAAGLLLFLRLR
jgi:hypothetical protein